MRFYDAQRSDAGGVYFSFTSPPQYGFLWCTTSGTKANLPSFPTDLPSDTDKVWTISLSRTGEIRVLITCNDKEVLNVVLSDATCARSHWRNHWDKDVEKIKFHPSDTASDYYRPGKRSASGKIYRTTEF